jgi:hypothetical protein
MKLPFLLALLLAASPALAHPLDLGFIQMKSGGATTIEISLDLNPSLAATLIEHGVTQLNPPLVESRYEELFSKTLGMAPLVAKSTPCTWSEKHTELLAQTVRLTALATCPEATTLDWSFPFIGRKEMPPTFQVLLKADFGAAEHVYTADVSRQSITISRDLPESRLGTFVLMGMGHIGALPSEWWGPKGFHIAFGIDHILFLLGLILAGGSLGQLVKTATGFTIGHSLTLAAASLGLITFPQRFIEAAIALSIAWVALETLLVMRRRSHEAPDRWRVAAVFGLVHGFGFAWALDNLGLTGLGMAKALVGFNLGVEIGQVILVAAMLPLLVSLRRVPWLNLYAVGAASGGIFMTGAYWFLRRALGL